MGAMRQVWEGQLRGMCMKMRHSTTISAPDACTLLHCSRPWISCYEHEMMMNGGNEIRVGKTIDRELHVNETFDYHLFTVHGHVLFIALHLYS